MNKTKIAVIVGSLRKESYNLKMAKALIALQPKELDLKLVEIGNLNLYNEDLEEKAPQAWVDFRNEIKEIEGLLFVTPECNKTIPAVLKNALDVGSRPYGDNVWANKPATIVSVTPGKLGPLGSNSHLWQSLLFLNSPTMKEPQAYISGAAKLFDEQGNLINDSTKDFMIRFLEDFAVWIKKDQ